MMELHLKQHIQDIYADAVGPDKISEVDTISDLMDLADRRMYEKNVELIV